MHLRVCLTYSTAEHSIGYDNLVRLCNQRVKYLCSRLGSLVTPIILTQRDLTRRPLLSCPTVCLETNKVIGTNPYTLATASGTNQQILNPLPSLYSAAVLAQRHARMTSSHNAIQTIRFVVSPRRPTNTFMCNNRISPNTHFLNQLYHSVPTSSLSLPLFLSLSLQRVDRGKLSHIKVWLHMSLQTHTIALGTGQNRHSRVATHFTVQHTARFTRTP